MGEPKQFFRFRLPWLTSAAAAPRPVVEPQPRPAPQTQAPSQPAVTIPIQRPPFRPAGIAPVQTNPAPVQAPPQKTEPQPVPSRGTVQTQIPSSTRIARQPEPTVQAVSKQQSPSRLVSQPTGQTTTSQPPSPPRRVSQVQTSSPPKISAMPPSSSTQPLSSASKEPGFKPFGVSVKPSDESNRLKDVAPITAAAKETPSAPVKPKEKVADEPKVSTKLLATANDAETKTRELLEQVKTKTRELLEKEDIERKKTMSTASRTDEKRIKTVSSSSTYPKDRIRNRPSNSHEKHVDSKSEQVPLHKEIREDISKFVQKLITGKPKLSTDEKSGSVVTLAGENSGASFHCKVEPDESPAEGEGSSRGRKPLEIEENVEPKAYVNSNTQSINNSIVFESSLDGRNPGVHLDLCRDAEAELLDPPQVKFH